MAPGQRDALAKALKNLNVATFVVPLVPLAYGLVNLRVGALSLGVLSAAVVALLFTSAVVPLRVMIKRGRRGAMRGAEVLVRGAGALTGIGGLVFAYLALVATSHAVGIDWPPARFVNPGAWAVISAGLAALSILASYFAMTSAVLLAMVREAAATS